MKRFNQILLAGVGLLSSGAAYAGSDTPVWVGDPINGAKRYAAECAACHGDDGRGGRTGVALTRADRLNLIRDDQMFQMIETGAGLKKPKDHALGDKLKFLEIWDVVAHTRTLHMTMAEFFPSAARYVSKEYTIDKYGLQRLEENASLVLAAKDQGAAVFTMFDFEGEEGNLKFVPQDPILLDQLKKPNKAGYLVFLPFKTAGFEGEIGVAMDAAGVITRLAVHHSKPGAELLNKSLSRVEGMGKKGQKTPFKVSGGKDLAALAQDVFPAYLRAMETVTMYDREERERTWADEE